MEQDQHVIDGGVFVAKTGFHDVRMAHKKEPKQHAPLGGQALSTPQLRGPLPWTQTLPPV